MTLPIIERPLYGDIFLETTAWTTPFSWVDRTAYLVNGISYSEGGRLGMPGTPSVDVGTLVATFKNAPTVPAVGDLVRLKTGASQYAFVGYVQDVSQRVVFDDSVSYTTPNVLTTIFVSDWVGYISQFQAVGAGGANETTGVDETDSVYDWKKRVAALNKIVDSSYATKIIYASPGSLGTAPDMGDTDMVGSLAEHLDLIAASTDTFWYGTHYIPTNKTTGRTSLIDVYRLSALDSSGVTFTDELGTSGQLHYVEIDFENSSENVANSIVANNRVRFHVPDAEVTKIGGFNEENYVVVNEANVVGIGIDAVDKKTDSTSITTYGIRQADVSTNVAMPVFASGNVNLIANPSIEYSDDGYFHGGNVNGRVRRRKPSEDVNPFTAFTGQWAMRSRITTAATNTRIDYSGGESDGIPAFAGTTYYFKARAARGTVSRTDVQAQTRVIWYDDTETQIGATVTGMNVSLLNANTWYEVTSGAIVAPANTVRAAVHVFFTRTGGGNHTVGDRLWADAYQLSKADIPYFDGDTAGNFQYAYIWTGGVGASPSYRLSNKVDDQAGNILTRYSTTSMRATRIRWNAQEDLTKIDDLSMGRSVAVRYDGTTTTYRIVGIEGNIDAERYMIDYYLAKA
jgi:hypothetical protein